MKVIHIILAVFIFSVIGCKESPPKDLQPDEPIAEEEVAVYPTMTQEQAQYLFEHANKVDVLFNDIAVSLSQLKKSDVQGQISFLSPGEVPVKSGCSETANIIFQEDDKIIGDGRMYLRGNCHYVVFYEDNKPVYGAFMTDQGMKFYKQILAAGVSTIKQ